MTLIEWENQLRENVCRFISEWRAANSNCPPTHPLDMLPGDWDEQFDLWCDEHRGGNNDSA